MTEKKSQINQLFRRHTLFFLKKYLLLLLFISLLVACKREEPTTWDTRVSAPLIRGKLGLDDILADSLLQSDENGLWHLRLTKNLAPFNVDSVISIPDTIIKKVFTPGFNGGPFSLPNGTTLVNKNENNILKLGKVKLKELITQHGFLEYTIKSFVNGYLTCTYEIPGVTLNNQPVVIVAETPPAINHQPAIVSGVINLSGYHFDLTGQNGFQTNTLFSHLGVKTSANAPANAMVYGTDSILMELKFIDPKIQYARGYFGQHDYAFDQMIDFGYNLPQGSIHLDQAAMKWRVENYIGVDAQIHLQLISSYNTQHHASVDLNHPPLYQEWNMTRAMDMNGSVTPSVHEMQLNEQNSNLNFFIENLPDKIHVAGQVHINPLGDVSSGNDFIYTQHPLNAFLDLDIPLAIGMQNLVLKDTLHISGNSHPLEADGTLYLYLKNAFPFQTSVNLYLLDEEGNTLSTLLQQATVFPASLTGTPGISAPQSTVLKIVLSRTQVTQIMAGNRLVIEAIFNTPNYPNTVDLYTSYDLDYVITTDAHTSIHFE